MNKQLKLVALGAGTLCLSGCASLELMAVGGVSYLLTGKGLSDHALSYVMNEDCAFHRIITDAPLCQESNSIDDAEADVMLAQMDAEALPENLEAESLETLSDSSEEIVAANSFLPEEQETVSVATAEISLPDEYPESTEIFAVVGSFNDLQHAFERSVLYRVYNTHIIENPSGSNTRYRVIVGPLDNRGLISQIPVKVGTENQLPWALDLCADTMMPPPCGNELLAKNTRHQ